MKGKWGTGIKLALAALGVIVVSTALKSFFGNTRSPGRDALFSIGTALLIGMVGGKFLGGGVKAAAFAAGVTLAGVDMLGVQASELGRNLANSFRGVTGIGGAAQPSTGPGAQGSYFSYGAQPQTMLLPPSSPPPASQPQSLAGGIQSGPAGSAPVTIIYEAQKPQGIAQSIVGAIGGIGQSFFGAGGAAGSLLGGGAPKGSEGVEDFGDLLSGSGMTIDEMADDLVAR